MLLDILNQFQNSKQGKLMSNMNIHQKNTFGDNLINSRKKIIKKHRIQGLIFGLFTAGCIKIAVYIVSIQA